LSEPSSQQGQYCEDSSEDGNSSNDGKFEPFKSTSAFDSTQRGSGITLVPKANLGMCKLEGNVHKRQEYCNARHHRMAL